jgi:hypothetical protein
VTLVVLSFTVVCPVTTLEKRWKGGLDGFRRGAPNNTFCCDGDLAGVSFMASEDAAAFIRKLEFHGLVHLEGERCKDIAVASDRQGLLQPCAWLHVSRTDPWCTVTLHGRPAAPAVGPRWWDPDGPPPTAQVPDEEVGRYFRFLEVRDRVCAFEDTRSGTLRYAAALHGVALARMLSLRLHHLVDSTQGPIAALEDADDDVLDAALVQDLTLAAEEAERIADASPLLASQALFLAARLARTAHLWEVAARRWAAFTEREPAFVGGWLELTWCRNMLGLHGLALEAAERAVALEPTDSAALGNLAATLHEFGRDSEAAATIRKALELAPGDGVNRAIARRLGVEPGGAG